MSMTIRSHPKYKNVWISGTANNLKLYTENLIPSMRVYGERLINFKGIEYREWDPYRSKLAALILENPEIDIFTDLTSCLYLGASSGTTISHLSDLIPNGVIFGVEFAERSIRQLIQNTSERQNIIPILGDANFPENYANSIFEKVDLVYQDVAQPNQAEIAIKNCNYYLKDKANLVFAIKSQSIDSVKKSEKVYSEEKKILEEGGFNIIDSINIHKYSANHLIIIARK
jgi:fibrillarin-like pre-rRNA processing protein